MMATRIDGSSVQWRLWPQAEIQGEPSKGAILLVYTGGTIGAVPSDRNDPSSPLKIANWEEFRSRATEIGLLTQQYKVQIDAVYLTHPLDSTNIEPQHWIILVDIITQHYDDYMGFVILHGTDTMVYTASALSFMLVGLQKPVVITGSQVPILDHPGSDGVRNLVNAIKVAAGPLFGLPVVPEVCIAFDKLLLRGNRARKVSADDLAGFNSPNFPPLGTLEAEISINKDLLWRRQSDFSPQRRINPNVISIQLFPGIQNSNVLAQCFSLPDLKGVVLQTYGTGNAPTSKTFFDTIEHAIKVDGKHILDVTQCLKGSVKLGQYETGIGLMKRGVKAGADITPEAALCKLMVFLGRMEMSRGRELAKYLQQSVVGEQSEDLYWSELTVEAQATLCHRDARIDLLPEIGHDTNWNKSAVTGAVLHLHNATIESGRSLAEFEIYLNLDPEMEPNPRHKGFCGPYRKQSTDEPSFVTFDVLKGIGAQPPGHPPKVSIVLRSDAEVTFTGASLLVFTRSSPTLETGQ
jgi:L-asparaginase